MREHREREGDGPRTFTDALQAAAYALPSYAEAQARRERARLGPMEVIVILNDDVEAGPVVEEGPRVTRVCPMPGSGDESSTGTLEISGRRRLIMSEVIVYFTPEGEQIICEFLASVTYVPEAGFAPYVPGLIAQVREQMEYIARRVA